MSRMVVMSPPVDGTGRSGSCQDHANADVCSEAALVPDGRGTLPNPDPIRGCACLIGTTSPSMSGSSLQVLPGPSYGGGPPCRHGLGRLTGACSPAALRAVAFSPHRSPCLPGGLRRDQRHGAHDRAPAVALVGLGRGRAWPHRPAPGSGTARARGARRGRRHGPRPRGGRVLARAHPDAQAPAGGRRRCRGTSASAQPDRCPQRRPGDAHPGAGSAPGAEEAHAPPRSPDARRRRPPTKPARRVHDRHPAGDAVAAARPLCPSRATPHRLRPGAVRPGLGRHRPQRLRHPQRHPAPRPAAHSCSEPARTAASSCAARSPTPTPARRSPSSAARATSARVQIDHVVALSDAWQKGAQQWSTPTQDPRSPTTRSTCWPSTARPTSARATVTPRPGCRRARRTAAPTSPDRPR